jgi:pilus assembly protein CpaE
MSRSIEILISSRSETELSTIQAAIKPLDGVSSESLLMVNGNTDPLVGLRTKPDVLILDNDSRVTDVLKSLSQRPMQDLPVVLLYGDELPTDAVKFAVRAGVRDVISSAVPNELAKAVSNLLFELAADDGDGDEQSKLLAVINAKGGSGSTFLASSIAHLAATSSTGDAIVVDLDFQFGSLPHYFDITPKRGLLSALDQVHELDRVAIEAYTAVHSSGLSVMAPLPDVPCSNDFDISERVRALIPILKSRYRHIVFDVPRHIDQISSPILQQADSVLMVLQQSLPSVRDAVRLKSTLVRGLGIAEDRLHVVVNRHLKSGSIELQDIREALGEEELALVPNHFRDVGQAIDMGMPIADVAPSSPVVKALGRLQTRFLGVDSQLTSSEFKGTTAIERLKQWSPF